MVIFCFAFSSAVILFSAIPTLPTASIYILCAGLLYTLSFCCWRRRYVHICVIFLGIACGWSWSMGWGIWQQTYQLPIHGEDWVVEGRIASLPEYDDRRVRFEFAVDKIRALTASRQAPKVKKLRLSWYGMPTETQLLPGQKWRFTVRAFRPHSFVNPGGFDYERWLLEKGIQGSGYIRGDASLLQSPRGHFWLRLRMSVRHQVEALDISPRARGIIYALMIGDRSHLSDEVWTVFFRTGISHLIAISGLHITLVGGFIFVIAFGVLRIFVLAISPLRVAALLALVVIWFYAFSVGFSLPTRRATLMISMIFFATIFMQRPRLLLSYALALAFVLLLHPLAGFSSGFYLSFAAVAIVLLSGRYVFARQSSSTRLALARYYCIRLFLLQWILVFCLVPFTALFFYAFSVAGLGVNLIAIPLTSFILMPWILITWLFLFLIPPLGNVSLVALAHIIDWLYIPLEWLAARDWSLIQLAQPDIGAIIFALLAMAIFLFLPRPSFYGIGALLFLPLFFPPSTAPPAGTALVSFLDVGQGLAVHIRTASYNLLYDAGPRYSTRFSAGSGIIIPYLHSNGISGLDRIIISHRDMDHSGGLSELLKHIEVDDLMLSFQHPLMESYKQKKCAAGVRWSWDGVSFQVLHPPADYVINQKRRNNNSCVLLVSIGEQKLLLTGDIERKVEEKLHQDFGGLRLSILQVPHHGSASSSHSEWVRSLRPDYAVFAAGYGNRFSHPAQEVMKRYTESQRLILWQTGMARFKMDDKGVIYKGGYRVRMKRYWYKDFEIH